MHADCGSLVVSPCNTTVGVWLSCLALLPVSRPFRFLTAFHASFLASPSLNFVEAFWACFWTNACFSFRFSFFFSVLRLLNCVRLSGVSLCGTSHTRHNILSAQCHIHRSTSTPGVHRGARWPKHFKAALQITAVRAFPVALTSSSISTLVSDSTSIFWYCSTASSSYILFPFHCSRHLLGLRYCVGFCHASRIDSSAWSERHGPGKTTAASVNCAVTGSLARQ